MIIFGEHDQKTLDQLNDVAKNAAHVALMADGHLGYVMPIGGVAAYRDQVSVVGVGFDIACGNCAIKTDKRFDDFDDCRLEDGRIIVGNTRRFNEIADEIASTISFGVGRTNKSDDAPVNHALFELGDWYAIPDEVREPLREKARLQLGTVGSGNHYVDIFADEEGYIWVGVHFGSRGLGHTIASGFLALGSGANWSDRVPEQEVLLPLYEDLGQRYWAAMELAGEYAYAGRDYVARKVVQILGANPVEIVHNHHNFAWLENHFNDPDPFVVVRKGATPAFPGQLGFIGGSMGDDAYIVRGSNPGQRVEDEVEAYGSVSWHILGPALDTIEIQKKALYSTVHGAGRVMSRSQAKGSRPKRNKETGEVIQKRKGLITRQMMSEWTKAKGVIVRGGDVDESPHVYRRLDEVIAAQGGTIEILHTLHPLIVVMAGSDVVDPYKD